MHPEFLCSLVWRHVLPIFPGNRQKHDHGSCTHSIPLPAVWVRSHIQGAGERPCLLPLIEGCELLDIATAGIFPNSFLDL